MFASDDAKNAYVHRVLEVISDDTEFELTRASAAQGLFNCASRLTAAQHELAWNVAAPISRGAYESHTFGSPRPDLLSNFQMTSNDAGTLRTAAIELLARLYEIGMTRTIAELDAVVRDALIDVAPAIRAAGVAVMRRVPDLARREELLHMLPCEATEVREQIIYVLGSRSCDDITPLLIDFADDPEQSVRWAVITVCEELHVRDPLTHIATQDPDAYTRALAALAIGRLD